MAAMPAFHVCNAFRPAIKRLGGKGANAWKNQNACHQAC